MTPQQIYQQIVSHFPGEKIELVPGVQHPVTKVQTGDDAIVVPAEKIVAICEMLAKIGQLHFDCLSDLTAVDRKDRLEVVYHLFSYKHRHTVVLKVVLPRDDNAAGGNAHLSTVEKIWNCANWLEREVFDLFGIKFDGHSDLRRIMLPDDWVGYPLRKDYQEQEDYHGISTTRPPLIQ